MAVADLLKNTPWQDWNADPIAGDASTRSYHRLTSTSCNSVILMQDPSGGTETFAKIARYLTNHGFAAPEIFYHDALAGTMVLTDLGSTDAADHISTSPGDEQTVYSTIADLLIELHACDPPPNIPQMTPTTASLMVDLAAIHYAQAPAITSELQHIVLQAYQAHVPEKLTFSLRDFHAQNLIWRPELTGRARLGLLDFQDACLAPVGYDLMSMIRDVRRDVSPDIARTLIDRVRSEIDHPSDAHLACVGAQRNLRILGVFARLIAGGKPQYHALLPRVWRQLHIDLAHPALHDLRVFVSRHLPKPEGS